LPCWSAMMQAWSEGPALSLVICHQKLRLYTVSAFYIFLVEAEALIHS